MSFSCQVVKQDDFDLSAVLLYKNNESLTSVGYSIGADQLPTQEQVRNNHNCCGVKSIINLPVD